MALRFSHARNYRIALLVTAVMTAVPVVAFAENDPRVPTALAGWISCSAR
jgi:hypothetical protein